MISLTVSNFSCITEASLRLNRLTVLIGPQASGKSVISKLCYFFLNVIDEVHMTVRENASFEDYKKSVLIEFEKYFPQTAWGRKQFLVRFDCGPITLEMGRAAVRKRGVVRLRFNTNAFYANYYQRLTEEWRNVRASRASKNTKRHSITASWEETYAIRQIAEEYLSKTLKRDYIYYQQFIPAGRSYFTSLGKAIAIFEHAGNLDPITLRFGREYISRRDTDLEFGPFGPRTQQLEAQADETGMKLLGGRVKSDRDGEYLETTDGRKISLSVLSSGQQELLPLWESLTTSNLFDSDEERLLFIEEPEAHLFPSAQNTLMQYLATYLVARSWQRMFITTHSPYVLAKINNLLKAYDVGAMDMNRRHEVEGVLPRQCWLSSEEVSAFAIEDGIVKNIVEERLIDATYLDEVSNEISQEFTALLEIQYASRD